MVRVSVVIARCSRAGARTNEADADGAIAVCVPKPAAVRRHTRAPRSVRCNHRAARALSAFRALPSLRAAGVQQQSEARAARPAARGCASCPRRASARAARAHARDGVNTTGRRPVGPGTRLPSGAAPENEARVLCVCCVCTPRRTCLLLAPPAPTTLYARLVHGPRAPSAPRWCLLLLSLLRRGGRKERAK